MFYEKAKPNVLKNKTSPYHDVALWFVMCNMLPALSSVGDNTVAPRGGEEGNQTVL